MNEIKSPLLRWQDIQKMFQPCGRNKALRILHQIGPTLYVGRTPYLHINKLKQYLDDHDGVICIDWSK